GLDLNLHNRRRGPAALAGLSGPACAAALARRAIAAGAALGRSHVGENERATASRQSHKPFTHENLLGTWKRAFILYDEQQGSIDLQNLKILGNLSPGVSIKKSNFQAEP